MALASAARRALGGAAALRPWAAAPLLPRLRSLCTGGPVDVSVFETGSAHNNVPPAIIEKVNRQLLLQRGHPLCTIKEMIAAHFSDSAPGTQPFQLFDDLNPVVTVRQNFDVLQTPADHVSRSPTDTFYLDEQRLLRCHTSAHQVDLLASGQRRFLVAGDVYRRDTVDATHYPIFHQMEGVRVFERDELDYTAPRAEQVAAVSADLRSQLEGMVRSIFGDVRMRWVDAYFPFTEPSYELEIWWGGDWLEVLGCGVMHKAVLGAAGQDHLEGWAFGLGLERLAMVLFGIPDIRLFWTQDPRFHEQFQPGRITTFQPYSKYPACFKDVAFWLPEDRPFHENDLHELVRGVAGDLAESATCIDTFTHPKTGRTSHCFRINYRSMDRSLTNQEVDALQEQLREAAVAQLGVELR